MSTCKTSYVLYFFLLYFAIVNPIKTWFWNRENIVQTTDLGQLHISYCHPTPSFFIFVRSIVLYCVKKGEYGMPYVLRKHRFKDTFNEANPIHNGLYMKQITWKMTVKNGVFKVTSNHSTRYYDDVIVCTPSSILYTKLGCLHFF